MAILWPAAKGCTESSTPHWADVVVLGEIGGNDDRSALKAGWRGADAIGMTTEPDPTAIEWTGSSESTCADCGSPIEMNAGTEKAFAICQPCYDAYVDNAGR